MKTIYKTLVLTLLLICTNTYAADVYYTTNGTNEITFKNGAVIYVDFSQVTSVNVIDFEIANMGNCAVEKHLPTYVKLTFQQNFTINNSNNNGAGLHWQETKGWSHNGKEWVKFLNDGKLLPFPEKDSDCNCIRVTLESDGSATYTWISGYTPGAPSPTPGGGSDSGTAGDSGFSSREHETAEGNGVVGDKVDCGDCYDHAY